MDNSMTDSGTFLEAALLEPAASVQSFVNVLVSRYLWMLALGRAEKVVILSDYLVNDEQKAVTVYTSRDAFPQKLYDRDLVKKIRMLLEEQADIAPNDRRVAPFEGHITLTVAMGKEVRLNVTKLFTKQPSFGCGGGGEYQLIVEVGEQ